MNQKLCKRLKREAVVQMGITPTIYNEKRVEKYISILNIDGKIDPKKVVKVTKILGDCTRGYYQHSKKIFGG